MFGKLGQGEDFADTLAATKGSNFDVIYDLLYVITFLFSKSETGLLFESMTQLLAHSCSHGYVYHQPIKWRASLAIFDCCCC